MNPDEMQPLPRADRPHRDDDFPRRLQWFDAVMLPNGTSQFGATREQITKVTVEAEHTGMVYTHDDVLAAMQKGLYVADVVPTGIMSSTESAAAQRSIADETGTIDRVTMTYRAGGG